MIIGIDIGGTEIKAGIVVNNRIKKKISVKTGKTKKEVINNIIGAVESLFNKNVKGIGIGCPGPADYKKGVIRDTPNLPLKNVNLKRIIYKKFRKKTAIENDANCFVLGEAARLNKKNVIGLTLGTGVGGGIVIGRRLYRGKGNAGEIGHSTIKFDGPKGINDGEMESFFSGRAIKGRYRKYPHELKSKKIWDEIGERIGIGIANLLNIFDPDIIVLGGGISRAFGLFRKGMNKEISRRAINKAKVVKGREDSGILGAAYIVKD